MIRVLKKGDKLKILFQPLDIEFIKSLHNRVNIVPVIAKADTLTKKEISRLKKRILDEIAKHNIKIYQLPDVEEDEEEDYKEQTRVLKVPFELNLYYCKKISCISTVPGIKRSLDSQRILAENLTTLFLC